MRVVTAPQLGPVSLVQRCFGEGLRVKVVMRHCAGVRGECVGTVLAFDKHLNLVSPINECWVIYIHVSLCVGPG